jgi:hypothetical protein
MYSPFRMTAPAKGLLEGAAFLAVEEVLSVHHLEERTRCAQVEVTPGGQAAEFGRALVRPYIKILERNAAPCSFEWRQPE